MPGRSKFRAGMEGRRNRSRINIADFECRRNTFSYPPSWENATQDPLVLATNGFYFTGQEDIVVCYACGVRLSRWKETDDPFTRHFQSSPNCTHLRKDHLGYIFQHCEKEFRIFREEKDRLKAFQLMKWRLSNLISYEELSRAGFFPTGKSDSIQCFCCGCMRETWHSGDSALAVHRSLCSDCPFLKELLAADHATSTPAQELPKAPDYSSLKVRLQSFKHFPSDLPVEKEELAKSGFYLVQPPSLVRCYACKITISSFKRGDLPDKIHVNKSPNCPLLKVAEEEAMSLPECPSVTPEVTAMDVEITPVLSPPPDPSRLPPPVLSEQDLQSMFRPSSAASFSSGYNGVMTHGAPSVSDQLGHSGSELSLQQTELDTLSATAHRQPMILDQPVYFPPSYHQKRVSLQPNSLPAHSGQRERMQYNPTLLSIPSNYPFETTSSRSRSDNCIICFVHPKEYAILPCGHLCSCRDCASKLSICPVCRCHKKGAVKIFDV